MHDSSSSGPHLRAVYCTSDTLVVLRPLAELPPQVEAALRSWLEAHEIDPDRLAVDEPVVRDSRSHLVSWYESTPGGRPFARRRQRWGEDRDWPGPFPADLLPPEPFLDPDGYLISPT